MDGIDKIDNPDTGQSEPGKQTDDSQIIEQTPDALKEENDKLKKEKENDQSFISYQQSQLAQAQNQITGLTPKASQPAPMPLVDNYDDNDQYQSAMQDWSKQLAKVEAEKLVSVQNDTNEMNRRNHEFNQQAIDMRTKNADFDMTVNSQNMQQLYQNHSAFHAAILESDISAELAYHLGKSLGSSAQLAAMPASQMYRELGKIEMSLKKVSQKKVSTSSNPVTTIKGSGNPDTRSATEQMNSLPDKEIMRRIRKGDL